MTNTTNSAFWGHHKTTAAFERRMKVWFNRAARKSPKTTPLHHLSHWSYLSTRQWRWFMQAILSHVRPRLKDGASVFESGCGAGALLQEVQRLNSTITIAGVDPADKAIHAARRVLDGEFDVGDGRKLRGQKANSYDLVISNCVVGYLDSLAEADRFVREMVRIAKPGAALCLATLIDPDGDFLGSIRLPIAKAWWHANAKRWGVDHVVIKVMGTWKYCSHQKDRYAVYMRKQRGPRRRGRARSQRG